MSNLYDVYPFTRGELLEFSVMTRRPDEADVQALAGAAAALLDSPVTDTAKLPSEPVYIRHRGIWLPEGIIDISEYCLVDTDGAVEPDSFEVELSIASEPHDTTLSRHVVISQSYSDAKVTNEHTDNAGEHQSAGFSASPRLLDYGIEAYDADDENNDILDALLAFRQDGTMPDHLDMLQGSVTQDPRAAEEKALTESLMVDLIESGELNLVLPKFPDIEPRITLASQRTIRKLTEQLTSFTA